MYHLLDKQHLHNQSLKLFLDNYVVAEVFIPAKDIGFIEKGMITDVRIDTFDFSEFGDIKGKSTFYCFRCPRTRPKLPILSFSCPQLS